MGLGPEDGDHNGYSHEDEDEDVDEDVDMIDDEEEEEEEQDHKHFDDDFDEMPPRHQDLDITGQYCATLSHKILDEFNDVKEDEDDCDYDNEDEDDDDGIDEVAPRHQAPQEHQGRLLP